MRVPVLTYQPMQIAGNGYRDNQLQALAEDLRLITESGFTIAPLRWIIDAWLEGRADQLEGKIVALTTSGGADFDYLDLPHPRHGTQRSAFNILRDFAAKHPGRQERLHLTSFVVASPEARRVLDATCMLGRSWWTDGWWKPAVESGLMHVGNGSWDHNHETLPQALSHGVRRGTFLTIDSRELADQEIRRAAEYLGAQVPNPGTALFAYPYGEANDYLAVEYFPAFGAELGIVAAFTAAGGFLTADTDRWRIPRLVCGRDWSSPDELRALLEGASERAVTIGVSRTQSAEIDDLPPRDEDFQAFLHSRVETIPGWLHAEAALLTGHLVGAQRRLELKGPTLEIGVFQGKYLCVLYRLSEPGETVLGVDLFIGAPIARLAAARVRSNIANACGDAGRLKILVADSLELTSDRLAREAGAARFRFISIDGGHTRELVLHDLEVAYPLLAEGGIMALDDAFNHSTPGVTEGIAEFFLRDKPKLAPFAVCYNKLFVTTPDFHSRYLRETFEFLDVGAKGLPTRSRTLSRRDENQASGFTPELFGYEVLPFL
jgi:hypothetical protein